jgi:ligand-binding SRPBCC domain-containing protein
MNNMLHKLYTTQSLKVAPNELWDFLSNPGNLAKITPGYMRFEVLSPFDSIFQGQIIEYHVRPLLGIKMHWVTEITHVVPGNYFVDEQRFGPYAFWHHQHFIKAISGGTELVDVVHYKLPLGNIGKLLNRCFVEKQLAEIFNYRRQQLASLWKEL